MYCGACHEHANRTLCHGYAPTGLEISNKSSHVVRTDNDRNFDDSQYHGTAPRRPPVPGLIHGRTAQL